MWLVMIDLEKDFKIIYQQQQRVQGDIYVNYKTAQKKLKFVMSSNIHKGVHKDKKSSEVFLE